MITDTNTTPFAQTATAQRAVQPRDEKKKENIAQRSIPERREDEKGRKAQEQAKPEKEGGPKECHKEESFGKDEEHLV